jgi:subtilisin family serine protease
LKPYADVRSQNLVFLHASLGESLIKTLWFNQATKWSRKNKPVAEKILEQAMNPGLGVRVLHAQGITGKGVNVAIIDQNLVPDHPEFEGKIVEYQDVGTGWPPDLGSMHAPAVTSLLVGDNIGTAPDAKVYFVASPAWTGDAKYEADALQWIIDKNEKLPADQKIRLVSNSAAPSGPGSLFTLNNDAWDKAYQRATEAGILVLDCTAAHGITAPCYYDLDDPENVAKCTPGWPGVENYEPRPDHIYVPTSIRTTAEEYRKGHFSYQYTGRAGSSWSVPYLAGVLAMGWQVNPDLTNEQILDILFDSAYVTEDGLKVINPKAFIDMVKLTVTQ